MTIAAATPKVTAKGQITLRRGLLDHIGARPGDRLEVVPTPGGTLEVRRQHRTGSISDFFNSIQVDDMPSLSIEEMNEVIAKGWAGELADCD